MGKYFTVEIKPTIPPVTAGQDEAYGDNELLFDWYAFDVPKGTSRLISADVEIRPKADAGASVNEIDADYIFAKTVNGNAPTSLGTVNGALTADLNSSNAIIGYLASGAWDAHEIHLDSTAFIMGRKTSMTSLFFTGEPDSGTNVGYDRFYVAAIAAGAFDFRSGITINNGTLDGNVFTVDGVDPRLSLAAGDTIIAKTAADATVSKTLGVIKSMADANTITLETTTENAIVDGDFIYNSAPITLRLHLER